VDRASDSSCPLLYTQQLCGKQTNALGVLFCSGRVWCAIRSEEDGSSPVSVSRPASKPIQEGHPTPRESDRQTIYLSVQQFEEILCLSVLDQVIMYVDLCWLSHCPIRTLSTNSPECS